MPRKTLHQHQTKATKHKISRISSPECLRTKAHHAPPPLYMYMYMCVCIAEQAWPVCTNCNWSPRKLKQAFCQNEPQVEEKRQKELNIKRILPGNTTTKGPPGKLGKQKWKTEKDSKRWTEFGRSLNGKLLLEEINIKGWGKPLCLKVFLNHLACRKLPEFLRLWNIQTSNRGWKKHDTSYSKNISTCINCVM